MAPKAKRSGGNPLSAKAVMADLTVHHWTGRKLDQAITTETNQRYHAEEDAGRYNKLLIPKEAFAEVYAVVRASRRRHFQLTMPWHDEGPRLLPAIIYEQYAKEFREFRAQFDKAADNFERAYPSYVGAANKRLKNMFRAYDYPPPRKVRAMFSFDLFYTPCPDVEDFRVDVAKEHVEDMKENLETQLKMGISRALNEPLRRTIEVVGKMATKLEEYVPATDEEDADNVFRDSLVNNIRELLPLLTAFNLTDNKDLEQLAARVEEDLCEHDAKVLREDDDVRAQVQEAAAEILAKAQALLA